MQFRPDKSACSTPENLSTTLIALSSVFSGSLIELEATAAWVSMLQAAITLLGQDSKRFTWLRQRQRHWQRDRRRVRERERERERTNERECEFSLSQSAAARLRAGLNSTIQPSEPHLRLAWFLEGFCLRHGFHFPPTKMQARLPVRWQERRAVIRHVTTLGH
eukprot:3878123-Rhodomonas_salina.1